MSVIKLKESEVRALIAFNKKLACNNLSENGDVNLAIGRARRAQEWAEYGKATFKKEFWDV